MPVTRSSDSTPLIAVAHGSRDPRSAATMAALVDEIRRRRPGIDVRLSFLDLNAPTVTQVVDTVAAEGHRRAVVAPLLLGSAFHARVDLPGLLARARSRHPELDLRQADVLGRDPRLPGVLRTRVTDTGVDPDDDDVGVVVAAVGSGSATANAVTVRTAAAVGTGTRWQVRTCFATTNPSVTDAVAELRAAGTRRFVVAPWFLAPGLLTDRVWAAARGYSDAVTLADPLGAHSDVADVVLDEYTRVLRSQGYEKANSALLTG